MTDRRLLSALMTGTMLVAGCAAPRRNDFGEVQGIVQQRIGQRVEWNRGSAADQQVDATLAALLKQPLSSSQAVQFALLNNPHLQATFEDIGIAQADLVQAGLLKNPVFDAVIRIPDRAPRVADVELSVAEDFLDIFLLPARKKLAAAQLEVAKAKVADEVLRLAADVQSAYYALQAQQQLASTQRSIADATSSAAQFAQRQHDAGNLSDLDLATHQALAQQAKLEQLRSEAQAAADRERLTRLMGARGDQAWRIQPDLPPLPPAEPDLNDLETLATRQRLDLSSARQEVVAAGRQLALARGMRFDSFDAGGVYEHDPDGSHLNMSGPTFSFPIPIFDQGQGPIARAAAQLRQSRRRLEAATIDAQSEVREARDRLAAARVIAQEYQDQIVPLRTRILEQMQLHYNGMLAGVYELLQARTDQAAARRESIEALRDYWIARSELERAVGGRLKMKEAP